MVSNAAADQLSLAELASFARELASAARRETLARFGGNAPTEDKGQGGRYDPVTEADRAAEAAMRRLIEQRFPNHGIVGEEFDDRSPDSRYCWSLDPIDGTRSYIAGLPTWTTLIALLDGREPVLGVIDAPRLDELYVGIGEETLIDSGGSKTRVGTSGCAALADARLSTTDPYLFEGGGADAFERLRGAVRIARLGHDGYAYARLAAGTLDLVVECGLKPHDYHALIPVVRGAGGTFGDWRGGTDFAVGNVIAAASAELYDAAVAIMRDDL